MAYFCNPDQNLAVALIPKGGNNTLRKWLIGFDVVANDNPEVMECDNRVLFVRNPLVRFVSGYCYYKGMAACGREVPAPVNTYEMYVDYVLENENEHWQPQSVLAGDLPTVIHRLEEWQQVGHRYFAGPISYEKKNVSARVPVNTYRLHDIIDAYEKDFDLWLGAEV